MKKILVLLLSLAIFFGVSGFSLAQEQSPSPEEAVNQEFTPKSSEFYLAKVSQMVEEGDKDLGQGVIQPFQKVKLSILSGTEKGKEIEIDHGSLFSITAEQKVKSGELVVVTKAFQPEGEIYYIADRFRLINIAMVFMVILALWAILGRGKNMGMLVALLGSLVVAYKYLVPRLIASPTAMPVTIVSLLLILGLIVFIGFGVSRKNTLIFISSLITALLGFGMTYLLVSKTALTGSGSQEAIFLQNGAIDALGLKNLLIAGISVGVLGIVAFVAKKQIEFVDMIKVDNKQLKGGKLVTKILINSDNNISHYLAVVFLVIVGTSLPLIMLFGINKTVPFWVTFNSEFMMGEIIRLISTMGTIVLAVPVTTLTAYFLSAKK